MDICAVRAPAARYLRLRAHGDVRRNRTTARLQLSADPTRLAAMRLGIDTVANAIIADSLQSPVGAFNGAVHGESIGTNDQLSTPADYRSIVVRAANGAIMMIENIQKNIEHGMSRLEAALVGARQIGFTVVSISLSLIAVFVPRLLMGGVTGRLLREFALTLSFAIIISTIVSLKAPFERIHYLVGASAADCGIWCYLSMRIASNALGDSEFFRSPKNDFVSTWSIRPRGGRSRAMRSRKAARCLSSPPTRMSTPSASFRTSPDRSSSCAIRPTVGRKPTPCTHPRTRISIASPIVLC
jgi:hypothetical protein